MTAITPPSNDPPEINDCPTGTTLTCRKIKVWTNIARPAGSELEYQVVVKTADAEQTFTGKIQIVDCTSITSRIFPGYVFPTMKTPKTLLGSNGF